MTAPATGVEAKRDVPAANHVDVVIIGSGFSGLGVAALLDRAGFRSFRVLEAADDLGGVWRDNTYPGCGCDIPSPLYSYSFDQKSDWSRLFGSQPEILGYLRDVATRRGLLDRIRFGQQVQQARWLPTVGRWEITTASADVYRARIVVCAVGPLHHPVYPAVPGLESFAGPIFHTAQWRHDISLTDQRVAVIGTGASAIQLVPAIADQTRELAVFQRTPPWIMPKLDRPFDERHQRWTRRFPPYRWWVRGRLFWLHERRAAGFVTDPAGMAKSAELAEKLIKKQVKDPELRERVTPNYTIGCKRLLISSDWYPALARPNVTVRSGVAEIRRNSVVDQDGQESPADVIILGTGFDAQDTVRFDIIGRDGRRLADAWGSDRKAYLGTAVAGFPNLFFMVGPNTGLGHNSQVFMIEAQARYIVDCLRQMRRRRIGCLEVIPEVQDRFNDWLDDQLVGTVWQTGGCRSWYQDPRSGRNTVLWPDTTIAFWRRTLRARLSDYRRWSPRPDARAAPSGKVAAHR